MKVLNIISFSIFQLTSILFVLGFLFGILNIYFSDKNNYCEMTYMYEYPQSVRITVPDNEIYPQYGLYAYSEGMLTNQVRRMFFKGVPVLFLPGNSGGHMQVRSLASVALRKGLANEDSIQLDFFTISYNEELSGLYGGVLDRQTKFAASCIKTILRLYEKNQYTQNVPTSIILIGHSMGGLIAKRLLTYPETLNTANIALTLAAPLDAPFINFDIYMNDYYKQIEYEWNSLETDDAMKNKKVLISIGNGPRDILMPSGLTYSNHSHVSGLTTAMPGVWVSPDHVSIVWCKQLVLSINKYLFGIISRDTKQVTDDRNLLLYGARKLFEKNEVHPSYYRSDKVMKANAFWYEDNRRAYQITRPQRDRLTYVMIRLVNFPQNRFVAIEAVNLDTEDWVIGCSASYTHKSYRYCKDGVKLREFTHWTGSAAGFGQRKLATINLHNLMEKYPSWTHVVVEVPPEKAFVLNVDINDYSSRQITVDLPSDFSFGKTIIKEETEAKSLYYELILPDFYVLHQAYLLYVEPTAECKATKYHVSAQFHVPWAKNNEYYHYFTQVKKSPMKLRLYKSNPNVTQGVEPMEHVKIILLLDPQCTYRISISSSWYQRLAQLARNYTPILIPYVAAIILLAARSNIMHLKENGTCISIHSALTSEGVKPYYTLVFSRLGSMALLSVPFLSHLFKTASWNNLELQYFTRSILVLPVYMTALGILNVLAAAVLVVMVFSSQLAHRLLFRIMWRGGTGLAEKLASGLQKVPMVVSAALVFAVPLSCGAASLAAGAAFYAFMLSKMYEEYLEDYVYKLMAKIGARLCRMFKSKKTDNVQPNSEEIVLKSDIKPIENSKAVTELETKDKIDLAQTNDVKIGPVQTNDEKSSPVQNNKEKTDSIQNDEEKICLDVNKDDVTQALVASSNADEPTVSDKVKETCKEGDKKSDDIDEDLNNLNFHMMMFFLWISVTLVNIPALLTWARNFKYSMVLTPDASYHTGLIMSLCSTYVWQMNGPRANLRHYESLAALLFTMAVFILALGPFSLSIVNYGTTLMFFLITVQQRFDKGENVATGDNPLENDESRNSEQDKNKSGQGNDKKEREKDKNENKNGSGEQEKDIGKQKNDSQDPKDSPSTSSDNKNDNPSVDCECSEGKIYGVFKNLKEKFGFNEDL